MDLSFIRRSRAATPDLSALLSRVAAMQSASPTARAQVRLDGDGHMPLVDDPHVALFADAAAVSWTRSHAAAFAALPDPIFRPRQ